MEVAHIDIHIKKLIKMRFYVKKREKTIACCVDKCM